MMLKPFLHSVTVAGLLLALPANDQLAGQTGNTAPKVTITRPAKSDGIRWNSSIPYSIAVIDHEDGNSAYDEIPVQDVILSVRYLPDSTQLKQYLSVDSRIDQEVLLQMSSATCFNCHQMKSKLIGPSFESISKKYSNAETTVASLADKVIKGTSGTWGDVQMPPHPDINPDRVQRIVRWILKNGSDPNLDYLRGIEGTFRSKEKPSTESRKAVYVLTASYTDKGDQVAKVPGKVGQHTLILKTKD